VTKKRPELPVLIGDSSNKSKVGLEGVQIVLVPEDIRPTLIILNIQ